MTTGKGCRACHLSNLGWSPTQSHEVGPDLLGCETLLQGTWEKRKNQSERANQSILWQEAFNGYNLSDRDDKGNTQTQLTRPDLGPARQEGDEGEQGSTC